MNLLLNILLAAVAQQPADYSEPEHWLCYPGREDVCAEEISATVISADGNTSVMAFAPARKPAADCFYVYPTVSGDASPMADLQADKTEKGVTRLQFAPFRTVCRTFAPVYRQVSIQGLRQLFAGSTEGIDPALAYADVAAAFAYYLEHENDGRPFVLIGHSQGTNILTNLIAREIDGKPVQERMLSAMLIGYNVPVGSDDGGSAFQNIPPCERRTDTGCVISYVSFRSDAPPPADALFGRADREGAEALCTNPADLDGGPAVLDAILPAKAYTSGRPPAPWLAGIEISTPFVKLPGLISGQCVRRDGASYLSISVSADPDDPRTDDIGGEVVAFGRVLPDWGLHLHDVGLAQGDLMDLVASQTDTYSQKN
jgi:pimeloyl-ACP methyl ester carboxylesterase